jgi:F-type H+-transporting ATPase subunit b
MSLSAKRTCQRIAALFAGLALIGAGAAQAAGGGEASGGLPQLDISTWPTQVFWLVVSFVLAYLLFSRLVTPRIGLVLEERASRINEDIAKAREAEAAARQTEADYLAELEKARSEASAQASQAMAEAGKTAAKAEAELAKKLARKVKSAEDKLAKIRDEAMAGLEIVAEEAASLAVEQLAGIKPGKALVAKQVKQAARTIQQEEAS